MRDLTNKLIGAQLIDFSEGGFTVEKENKKYTFIIIEDYGDCCGYNNISAELLVTKEELSRNPIITNAVEEWEDNGDAEIYTLTLFGESKKMAELETLSSSGSGWGYGACVTLKCFQTLQTYDLSSW